MKELHTESGPLISVVMPSYNSAELLSQTVTSVLQQSWPWIELIIVDDGSRDETRKVLEPFENRITYIYQDNFGGPSKGRNVGIERARGEWIALFDSDDLMEPDKLQRQARIIETYPQIDLVFTDFRVIDERGNTLDSRFVRRYQEFRAALTTTDDQNLGLARGRDLYPHLLAHNFIGTSSVLARRELFREAGGFDESIRNGDDRDMWYRLARADRQFAFCDEVCHAYRMRQGNITSTAWRRLPAQLQVLERQRPHVSSHHDRQVLEDRIRGTLLAYAWSLRKAGKPGEACRQYKLANSIKPSWKGYKGIALSSIERLTGKLLLERDPTS